MLHGRGTGVRLHDGGKLERQHKREQLLQYGRTQKSEEAEYRVAIILSFRLVQEKNTGYK